MRIFCVKRMREQLNSALTDSSGSPIKSFPRQPGHEHLSIDWRANGRAIVHANNCWRARECSRILCPAVFPPVPGSWRDFIVRRTEGKHAQLTADLFLAKRSGLFLAERAKFPGAIFYNCGRNFIGQAWRPAYRAAWRMRIRADK